VGGTGIDSEESATIRHLGTITKSERINIAKLNAEERNFDQQSEAKLQCFDFETPLKTSF
jgi:hypothetical protein